MRKTKGQKLEQLFSKASNCEEHFRRFDPKREVYTGNQRHDFLTAYTRMERAKKKLAKFLSSIETEEEARQM